VIVEDAVVPAKTVAEVGLVVIVKSWKFKGAYVNAEVDPLVPVALTV